MTQNFGQSMLGSLFSESPSLLISVSVFSVLTVFLDGNSTSALFSVVTMVS